MHADEPDIDVSLVRRLIEAQFPQWSGLVIEPVVSTGTDNKMYRLGDDMAVRLPRVSWAAGNVAEEQALLPWLAPRLPVPIPAALAQGTPAEGYPWNWSVYRWLHGENPVVGRVEDPEILATDLAAFITALQGLDTTGAPPAGRGVPLVQRDAPTRRAIAELAGADTETIDIGEVTDLWEEAIRLPEWTGPPTWVHGDLSAGNVLVGRGRLSGVIDFAGVGVGNPTVHMNIAWNLLPAEVRGVFRAALDVDDATWLRGRAWALSIALIQLPYYQHTNPGLAVSSRYVINEVLRAAR